MPDIWTKEKRSQVMATIRSKGNKDTELKLMSIMRRYGIKGWRRHQGIHGTPDFVFREQRIAVFVDGCFWHGCQQHCRLPKSRTDFWIPKIAANRARDRKVARLLKSSGWRVLRLWEHALRKPPIVARRLQGVLASTNIAGYTE